MSIPLLSYKPASQNQRVPGYQVPDEDTPYTYRLEDCASETEIQALIWATYRQIFGEHETLQSNRQSTLESQLKNRTLTVRDFVRGLAKSEAFRRLVVEPNSNYRLVEVCLKRLLGRAPYNQDEEIAWSIKIATLGWGGFVDALVDSQEYQTNFGENIVPYQRRRYKDRPFNLVTPRYGSDWRDKLDTQRHKWGDISNFLEMARSLSPAAAEYKQVQTANIQIPDTSRDQPSDRIPASVNPIAGFPLI